MSAPVSEPELRELRKLAEDLARRLGERASTAHLLAAIVAEPSSTSELIRERRIAADDVLRTARGLAGDELAEPIASALTRAKEIGARMGTNVPSSPHLLLALLGEPRAVARRTLESLHLWNTPPFGATSVQANSLASAVRGAFAGFAGLFTGAAGSDAASGAPVDETAAQSRAIDAFAAAGGDRAIAVAVFGVRPDYLAASFDEMERSFGTVETYFTEGLGVDAGTIRTLRAIYLI